MEEWQTIRHLHTQGRSARSIAEELGISRNTVRRALAQEEPPHYQRSGSAGQALEPYREAVTAGLQKGLRGVRLLKLVRQAGYTGSQTAFYDWLRPLRQVQKNPAACRFETAPGEQMQFDWATYTVLLAGQPTKVFVFALVLGYCRRVHWFPSLAEDMDALFEALVVCLAHFGGACRFLLVDNPKALVARHDKDGVRFNDQFLQLCGHYRIQPLAGTPRHPQGKGKVENPFAHLEDWVVTGNQWHSFDHFWDDVRAFEAQWEGRVHGTTKQRPLDRFEEERPELLPLPVRPFPTLSRQFRLVSNDCLVSVEGARYSVPWEYAGQRVRVRLSQGRHLVVCDLSGVEVARHERRPAGAPPAICTAHYEGLRHRQRACLATLLSRYRDRYAGEVADAFLQQLLSAQPERPERALEGILELLAGAPQPVALAALADAVALRLHRRDHLEELLRRRLHQRDRAQRILPVATTGSPSPDQPALPQLAVERDLALYERALAPRRPEPR